MAQIENSWTAGSAHSVLEFHRPRLPPAETLRLRVADRPCSASFDNVSIRRGVLVMAAQQVGAEFVGGIVPDRVDTVGVVLRSLRRRGATLSARRKAGVAQW